MGESRRCTVPLRFVIRLARFYASSRDGESCLASHSYHKYYKWGASDAPRPSRNLENASSSDAYIGT